LWRCDLGPIILIPKAAPQRRGRIRWKRRSRQIN
jgi:hypothetical protein